MNMLLRFFILMILLKRQHASLATQKSVTQKSATSTTRDTSHLFIPFSSSYRVLPHDMGFRDHLPNYRYLSFIELNITGWLTQIKQHNPEIVTQHGKVMWIISMQEMVYLKPIKFLDKIKVSSQIEGWDSKYIYFQHHFYVKNKVRAIGLTKFLLANHKGKLSPSILGLEDEKITEVIKTWNANQTAIKAQ